MVSLPLTPNLTMEITNTLGSTWVCGNQTGAKSHPESVDVNTTVPSICMHQYAMYVHKSLLDSPDFQEHKCVAG